MEKSAARLRVAFYAELEKLPPPCHHNLIHHTRPYSSHLRLYVTPAKAGASVRSP